MSDLGVVLWRTSELFLNSLVFLVLARVALSWFYPNLRNTLVYWVWRLSEPVLAPLRRILPHTGIDLSPWAALILIFLARQFIFRLLYTLF
jgi:YggT family protein